MIEIRKHGDVVFFIGSGCNDHAFIYKGTIIGISNRDDNGNACIMYQIDCIENSYKNFRKSEDTYDTIEEAFEGLNKWYKENQE